jgi:uncharacterized phiE125 gp8 family phage protein
MNYNVIVTTPPGELPVKLANAKMQCRRTDTTAEDALLEDLIAQATATVEKFTGRALITQTLEVSFWGFPCGRVLELPRPQVQSVTSVKYFDEAGVEQTLSSGAYHVDTRGEARGRIVLHADYSWPTVQLYRPNSVIVRYVAGYGGAAAVPQPICQAILLYVEAFYGRAVSAATQFGPMNTLIAAAERLLEPYCADVGP